MTAFSSVRRKPLEWLLIVALSLSVPPLVFSAFVHSLAESGGIRPDGPAALSELALAFGAVALLFRRLRVGFGVVDVGRRVAVLAQMTLLSWSLWIIGEIVFWQFVEWRRG